MTANPTTRQLLFHQYLLTPRSSGWWTWPEAFCGWVPVFWAGRRVFGQEGRFSHFLGKAPSGAKALVFSAAYGTRPRPRPRPRGYPGAPVPRYPGRALTQSLRLQGPRFPSLHFSSPYNPAFQTDPQPLRASDCSRASPSFPSRIPACPVSGRFRSLPFRFESPQHSFSSFFTNSPRFAMK
jgi:hypothetical protein